MTRISYVEASGITHTVDVEVGLTLMEGAVRNGVPGIVAECGGACACATCHVFIDRKWRDVIGAPTDLELATAEFVNGRCEDSRLSCQIRIRPELNGLVVRMPEQQG